ncbi:hypothetical protein PR202_ga18636 [Eleusine coracana subsp. coracana]|uniref:Exostosin GT47 domain-containing protein n=1 Tax=Eleusine coracana subsp. coracana TaxID=191504 RepID=A0AAV5CTI1_ELECO|nr:hypothetical protein PR202_ga18636 [Eleusine coracana subsp. coracana]
MARRPLAVSKISPAAAMKQLAVLALPILLLLLSLSFLLLRPTSPSIFTSSEAPKPRPPPQGLRRRPPPLAQLRPPRPLLVLPSADSRIPATSDPDHPAPRSHPTYPESPLIKQYSAEYWLLASLQTAAAVRVVKDWREADVVFVPFFATLSAEMELGWGTKGAFRRKDGNHDYRRQREVVDRVTAHPAWRRSGGRDHVFVLTDPVAMWHVRAEIAPAILLGGLVREKLWDLLGNEPDIVMEEGFPNATGREQSIKGMRSSEFCLHPAGDTPTSCRLFDAIASLCIPVIVSDEVELPFEGMIDYTEFSIFVSVSNALRPGWLTNYLRNISKQQKDEFRRNLAHVQHIFEYDISYSSSNGLVPPDGAVSYIWKKIHQKSPMIREAVTREKRKPDGASIPLRCHCT